VKKRKELLERLVENAPSIIIGVNFEGNIMFFNRSAEGITGYAKKEAVGENFFTLLIPENEREEIKEIFNEIREGGGIYYFERHMITKSGEERYIFWSSGPMLNSEDVMIGNICIGNDISEQEIIQAMEELRDFDGQEFPTENETAEVEQIEAELGTMVSQEDGSTADVEWECAFNSIADPIVILSKDNIILRANSAFMAKMNILPNELIGMKCCNVFHDENSPIKGCFCKKIFEEGKAYTEEVYNKISGTTTLVSCSPYFDSNGDLAGTILIAKEVAKGKEKEEVQKAPEKIGDISPYVFALEHEIDNPLGGILGYAHAILDEEDPLKIRIYSQEIVDAASSVIDLLNSLSRNYSSQVSYENEEIDLNHIIESSIDIIRQNANFQNVEVITDLKQIPKIKGSSNEIQELFMNLLSNSIETLNGNGKIFITTNTFNGSVQAVFRDDGTTIPKEHIHKIFDPFFLSTRGKSLKLYEISRILKKHNAPINVESESGKGTSFVINFPRIEADSENT